MARVWRVLEDAEIKRLLTPKKKRPGTWDEVVHRGYEPRKDIPVVRYTLEKVLTKVVDEQDAQLLINHGWTIVAIDDPFDDD